MAKRMPIQPDASLGQLQLFPSPEFLVPTPEKAAAVVMTGATALN